MHQDIPFTDFNGLYIRSTDDECPLNHFPDGLNFDFFGKQVGTRYGFHRDTVISNVKRTWSYRRTGEATRTLILVYIGGNGSIYDSTSLGAPILGPIAGMTDFSALNIFNRAFITPHNGVTGLAGESVYVYNGSGTARAALGAKPVGAITLTNTSSGNIEVGDRLVSIAYETDTGFITVPITPQVITAPGGEKIHVANIPTGPAYVSARWVLASQVITYNGNPLGFQMFFVPNGRIGDNVTTTFDLNVFDEELISSADYLFDELETLPACIGMTNFASRLITYGENASPSTARVSALAEPESFSASSGLLTVDPTEVGGITGAIEFRGSLYITKGSQTYATSDNGGDPDTWDTPSVDGGIGTPSPFGIGHLVDNKKANLDYFPVATIGGLQIYNGTFVSDPLSYKISGLWARINKLFFNLVQVVNDTQHKKIYVLVPLDSSTTVSHILVCDYVQGLNASDVRWTMWNSAEFNFASISVVTDTTSGEYVLKVAGTSNLYSLLTTQLTDNGTTINSYIRFALAFLAEFAGWIQHFWQVQLRVWGSGTLNITMQGEDNITTLLCPSIPLTATPGQEKTIKANFQNEKCSVKLACSNSSDWFRLASATLSAKKLWKTRPQ